MKANISFLCNVYRIYTTMGKPETALIPLLHSLVRGAASQCLCAYTVMYLCNWLTVTVGV